MRQDTTNSRSVILNTDSLPNDIASTSDRPCHTQSHAESARVDDRQYDTLDPQQTKDAFAELDTVLNGLADTVICTLDQMIPYLDQMQSLLSQRGSARKKVLKAAQLPSWTEWAASFALKFDCSLRTIQERIQLFRGGNNRESSASRSASPVKLNARQQSSLVKAQLIANDVVAALKNGGDWATPLAEYERVAVSPSTLSEFMTALNPEPDWKSVLNQLVAMLEAHLDKLPAPVIDELCVVQELLAPTAAILPEEAVTSAPHDEDIEPACADVPSAEEPEPLITPANVHPEYWRFRGSSRAASADDMPLRSGGTAPSIEVTVCSPSYATVDGNDCERVLSEATDYYPAQISGAGFIRNEFGKLEYVGRLG